MEDLSELIADLEEIDAKLLAEFEQLRSAGAALATATMSGRGNMSHWAAQVDHASQAWGAAQAEAVRLISCTKEFLVRAAPDARAQGVIYPEQATEQIVLRVADDYPPDELQGLIQQAIRALRDYAEAVEIFDRLQAQITEILRLLEVERARLDRLNATTVADLEGYELLYACFSDPSKPRDKLLADANALFEEWCNRLDSILRAATTKAYHEIGVALSRLENLNARSRVYEDTREEFRIRIDSLQRKIDESQHGKGSQRPHEFLDEREVLLAELGRFLSDCLAGVQEIRGQIEDRVHKLVAEAQHILGRLHPSMPEAISLQISLEQQGSVKEHQLLAFLAELENLVAEARNAGLHALARYQAVIAADNQYVFKTQAEVDQVGTAILLLSGSSEYYSGRLWTVGEDVLLRAIVADFDIRDFFNKYGYPSIACALRAAVERRELPKALSVLNTAFLPPAAASDSSKTQLLLVEPVIQEVFEFAAESGALRLSPDDFGGLGPQHRQAILKTLEHADDIGLPVTSRLQWIALLHAETSPDNPMHRRISQLLIRTLFRAGHYLSLYYALGAMTPSYPDFWEDPEFRPMLRHVIVAALALGSDGRRFILELSESPETMRLSVGDFESEFLLSSLAHYAAVKWGHIGSFNSAWAAWERLGQTYPALSEVLLLNLQGQQYGDETDINVKGAKKELDDLFEDIEMKFKSPGYSGVRLAAAIHRWYVEEFMQEWLDVLQARQVKGQQLDDLLQAVVELRQVEDLVERCPLQRDPPDSAMRPLEGRLKDKLNNRLFELLLLFQDAIRKRQRLSSRIKDSIVFPPSLSNEIERIRSVSPSVAWAVETLLPLGDLSHQVVR